MQWRWLLFSALLVLLLLVVLVIMVPLLVPLLLQLLLLQLLQGSVEGILLVGLALLQVWKRLVRPHMWSSMAGQGRRLWPSAAGCESARS